MTSPITRPRACAALLVIAVALAYFNAVNTGFVLDDIRHILEAQRIRTLFPVSQGILDDRRPLGQFTFAINYAIHGLDPRGYKLVNILIHALAGLTLFDITRRCLRRDCVPAHVRSRHVPIAFAASLIFLVHPIQSQGVTYAVQRLESLASLFGLLGLAAFVRFLESDADQPESPRRWLWAGSGAISLALGVLTKEIAFVVPFMAVAIDHAFFGGLKPAMLKRRWPAHLVLLACWAVLYLVISHSNAALARHAAESATNSPAAVSNVTSKGVSAADPSLQFGFNNKLTSPAQYAKIQSGVIIHYLGIVLWPRTLVLDYFDWPTEPDTREVLRFGSLVGILLLLSIYAFIRAPWLGVWPVLAFLALGPTSSFFPIADVVMEHRMYLPMAGLSVALALLAFLAIQRIGERFAWSRAAVNRVACAALLVASCALIARTAVRNLDYRTTEIAYRAGIRDRPDNPRNYLNLASALLAQDDVPGGAEALLKFVSLVNTDAEAYKVLGAAMIRLGRPHEAIPHLRAALSLHTPVGSVPALFRAETLHHLGRALTATGQCKPALEALRSSEQLAPGVPDNAAALGDACLQCGDQAGAEREYLRALKADPRHAGALAGFAESRLAAGDFAAAAAKFSASIAAGPSARAFAGLATLAWSRGEFQTAFDANIRAALLDPHNAEHPRRAAWIHAVAPEPFNRDIGQMLALARAADEMTHHADASCLDTLAAALARAGRYDEAVVTAVAALDAAKEKQNDTLTPRIQARLDLYRQSKPFTQQRPTPQATRPASQPAPTTQPDLAPATP